MATISAMYIAVILIGQYYEYCAPIFDFLNGNRAQVYAALASISGSLLGFIMTAVSIIAVFMESSKLEAVKQSKFYPYLWKTFTSTIRYLAIATIVFLVSLMFDREDGKSVNFLTFVSGWAIIAVLARVSRCVWVLEQLISVLVLERTNTEPPDPIPLDID